MKGKVLRESITESRIEDDIENAWYARKKQATIRRMLQEKTTMKDIAVVIGWTIINVGTEMDGTAQ